ncbi:hypothetical protein BGAL_0343g00060 [Botrytis galanthina]|uniref:Uncharacterized protein n=1 Tax=Botrytis galanthina TaxID=278940 RepID=A0A4S8QZ72_9HELO|nr:hypothetical protein BGAL_0343g00060 [Botrytis galanthina]
MPQQLISQSAKISKGSSHSSSSQRRYVTKYFYPSSNAGIAVKPVAKMGKEIYQVPDVKTGIPNDQWARGKSEEKKRDKCNPLF